MTQSRGNVPPVCSAAAGRRSGLAVRVCVILLSTIVTLAAAEIGLRLYIDRLTPEARESSRNQPLMELPGSGRIYGLKPSLGPPIHSNALGFRGEEFSREKPPGVFRIVMLGDSITFGNAVAWNETFSHRLQTRLNDAAAPPRVEVLNLGVSGYNTQQELATLQESGLGFSPDLIVLNVCMNDSDPIKRLYGLALKNETPVLQWSDINVRTIVDSSYLLTLLKHQLGALLRSAGIDIRPLNSPALFLDNRVYETAWREMKATMRRMHEVTATAGIPLVAVLYPYKSQVGLTSEQRVPQQDLLTFFAETGIPALDLAPAYLQSPTEMFVDGYLHLSPTGHATVAAAMRTFLAERTLLPRTALAPDGGRR